MASFIINLFIGISNEMNLFVIFTIKEIGAFQKFVFIEVSKIIYLTLYCE